MKWILYILGLVLPVSVTAQDHLANSQNPFFTLQEWFEEGEIIDDIDSLKGFHVGRCFHVTWPSKAHAAFFAYASIEDKGDDLGPGFPSDAMTFVDTLGFSPSQNVPPDYFDNINRLDPQWPRFRSDARKEVLKFSHMKSPLKSIDGVHWFYDISNDGRYDLLMEYADYDGYIVERTTTLSAMSYNTLFGRKPYFSNGGDVHQMCYFFKEIE